MKFQKKPARAPVSPAELSTALAVPAGMQIEMWPIDRLIPYARNARKLSPRALDVIVSSLKEFGFRQPIVVDKDGVIVAGHTRLLGARKLGMAEVPVHVASNLTPGQCAAYRIMDNRSNQETSWDFDLLGPELLDLKALDFDLELTGFDTSEIEGLLVKAGSTAEGLTDEDETPEAPVTPVTVPGDLWLLGGHRVLCGDSTDPDCVSRLLSATSGLLQPLLMVTDPPYGVEYDAAWREEYDDFKRHAVGKVANDDRVDWTEAYALFPGSVAYVWHAGIYAAEVATGILAAGFQMRGQIIWKKQHFVFGRGAYHWQHEPCWYAVRKGQTAHWQGDRKQTTVWEIANLNPMGGNTDEAPTGHGTQKPVECMRRPIVNHTKRGEAVYDPFLGSGTTLIAAELTERICYGLELEPGYVDVIVRRWQDITGNKANHDQTGRTFDDLAAERLGVTLRVPEVAA